MFAVCIIMLFMVMSVMFVNSFVLVMFMSVMIMVAVAAAQS